MAFLNSERLSLCLRSFVKLIATLYMNMRCPIVFHNGYHGLDGIVFIVLSLCSNSHFLCANVSLTDWFFLMLIAMSGSCSKYLGLSHYFGCKSIWVISLWWLSLCCGFSP